MFMEVKRVGWSMGRWRVRVGGRGDGGWRLERLSSRSTSMGDHAALAACETTQIWRHHTPPGLPIVLSSHVRVRVHVPQAP
eukprot:366288-Chlamydomonas_euryale.AAC.2